MIAHASQCDQRLQAGKRSHRHKSPGNHWRHYKVAAKRRGAAPRRKTAIKRRGPASPWEAGPGPHARCTPLGDRCNVLHRESRHAPDGIPRRQTAQLQVYHSTQGATPRPGTPPGTGHAGSRLVVDDLLLEVGLRVLADRADLRGLLANVQVAAVEALPHLDAREPPHSTHHSAHSFELNSIIPVTFQPVNFIARR